MYQLVSPGPRARAGLLGVLLTSACTTGIISPGQGRTVDGTVKGGQGGPSSSPRAGTGGSGPAQPGPDDLCSASALMARPSAPTTRLRRLTTRELQTSTSLLFDQASAAGLAN